MFGHKLSGLFRYVTLGAIITAPLACGGGSSKGTSSSNGATISGTATAGQVPVAGATISLWSAGITATQLGSSATTDSNGSFSFNFACPESGTLIYATATGGTNSYIYLTSALGACGSLPASVVINEVTTVAAAYALNGFVVAPPDNSGAPLHIQGKPPGLDNAFATVSNLVSASNGLVAKSPAVVNQSAVANMLNSLSDALAACDNSNSVSTQSPSCAELFSCATQGAAYGSHNCTGGATPLPTNTFSAAWEIAKNAGIVSIEGIYDVSTQSSAYSPTLSAVPTDLTLLLAFAVPNTIEGGPLAIDGSGNVWTFNSASPSYLYQVSPAGSYNKYNAAGPFSSGNSNSMAIDSSDNIWVGGTDQVAEFSPAGTETLLPSMPQVTSTNCQPGSGLSGGSIGMAFDPNGDLWVGNANVNGNCASDDVELSAGGSMPQLEPQGGYPVVGGTSLIEGLAVDNAGHVWNVTHQAIVELSNSGTLLGTCGNVPSVNTAWWSVAVDQTGTNLWVMDTDITAPAADYVVASKCAVTPHTGGGINAPTAVAVDGAGHVWIANHGGPSVTELGPNGAPLSPAVGFDVGGAIDDAQSIGVDQSGNVWVGDGTTSLYELVGAAAPTKNPIVSAVNTGFTP